jgi:hypothetical protein
VTCWFHHCISHLNIFLCVFNIHWLLGQICIPADVRNGTTVESVCSPRKLTTNTNLFHDTRLPKAFSYVRYFVSFTPVYHHFVKPQMYVIALIALSAVIPNRVTLPAASDVRE